MGKPTYGTTSGERVTTSVIDRRTSEAKWKAVCAADSCCKRCYTNQGRLTCSHIVSVKAAKEEGCAELCWDVDNIELLCEKHHLEVESWTAEERLAFYNRNK